jgi:hypothetical protein
MADANKLGTAMLIAPFAGVVAAAGKIYSMAKTEKEDASDETE